MIDFDKMIDKFISRELKEKKVGRYYPSEIGSCLRKVWYSYKYPLEVRPDLLKLFEVGNMMHNFIVDVLKSEKTPEVEVLMTEFPFRMEIEDFVISGRIDDLILLMKNGKKWLVEVKSCRDIRSVKKPNVNHAMQLQLYMHAIGVHNGMILYVDKTNLKTKIFVIPYDEKRSLDILKRFGQLHSFLVDKELPPAEAKQTEEMKWMCRFCEYKDKCDKNSK